MTRRGGEGLWEGRRRVGAGLCMLRRRRKIENGQIFLRGVSNREEEGGRGGQ